MKRRMILTCVVAVVLVFCVSAGISFATNSDINFRMGQILKDALNNKENYVANVQDTVVAKYDGTPITTDVVCYYKDIHSLIGSGSSDNVTDLDVINGIIETMILVEEAERRGLTATDKEIEAIINNAIISYSYPEGKEMMDAYFEGAGITFDEYLAMLREQAPRTIARQKLLDAVGREYCEENGLEFTKINPPDELVAAQNAYIKDLFEQNKHKIVYFVDAS